MANADIDQIAHQSRFYEYAPGSPACAVPCPAWERRHGGAL